MEERRRQKGQKKKKDRFIIHFECKNTEETLTGVVLQRISQSIVESLDPSGELPLDLSYLRDYSVSACSTAIVLLCPLKDIQGNATLKHNRLINVNGCGQSLRSYFRDSPISSNSPLSSSSAGLALPPASDFAAPLLEFVAFETVPKKVIFAS